MFSFSIGLWIPHTLEQPAALTEYDEPLVRRLIEKVTIFENTFTVEFKSGISVNVNASQKINQRGHSGILKDAHTEE